MIGKSFLPKSLFGRALLILVLPTVLIQLVSAYIFFERHWDNVSRYMSNALVGEVAFFVKQVRIASAETLPAVVENFKSTSNMEVEIEKNNALKQVRTPSELVEFRDRLHAIVGMPLTVQKVDKGDFIEIRIQMERQVIQLRTTVKRLESRTTVIYLLWMAGASALFLLIAVLFLKNQIRPIRRLAEAAENFGRGVDTPDFRPHGALEVRKAAKAFIIMRERITRQIRTRTEMLAGISHDLRTPLTRMKLQLAMLGDKEATAELQDDVQQMEHMIQEYLDFARGEGREEAIDIDLRELLEDVVADYQRMSASVTLSPGKPVRLDVRVTSFRRMLHNLIDNALRYARQCTLSLSKTVNYCELMIDDDGPGIPKDKRDEVFKPFSRLDPSRNLQTGGVGLGLTIARDIVLAHGGHIVLEDSPMGGLRVTIRLSL